MAHSFVQAHPDEMTAFMRFADANPGNVVLLIDTYDTEAAAEAWIASHKPAYRPNPGPERFFGNPSPRPPDRRRLMRKPNYRDESAKRDRLKQAKKGARGVGAA